MNGAVVVQAPPSLPFLEAESSYHADPRGKPWSGYSPEKDGPLYDGRTITRRLSANHKVVFDHVHYATWGKRRAPQEGVPEARVPLRQLRQELPVSEHHIRSILADLERVGWIRRPNPQDPWQFETHPEYIAFTPLRTQITKPELSKALKERAARRREAQLSAPSGIAALRGNSIPSVAAEAAETGPIPAAAAGNTFPSALQAAENTKTEQFCAAAANASDECAAVPNDTKGNLFPSAAPAAPVAAHAAAPAAEIHFPTPEVRGTEMHFLLSHERFTRFSPVTEIHFCDREVGRSEVYLRCGEVYLRNSDVEVRRAEMDCPGGVPCPRGISGLSAANVLNDNQKQTSGVVVDVALKGRVVGNPEKAATTTIPPTFEEIAELYPASRVDPALAKAVWFGDRQRSLAPMPTMEKRRALDGVRKHLESELWRAKPHIVPLLSNFLRRREYAEEPPPLLVVGPSPKLERSIREMQAEAAFGRWFWGPPRSSSG